MMKHNTYTKILVIDKSARYAHNIAQQLQSSSLQYPTLPEYDIKVATTGLDALLLAHEFQPDCILLNYNLPDMSGLEFVETLTEIRNGIVVPILLLVEPGNESAVFSMMKYGQDNFLVKGKFDLLQLAWMIGCLLEKATLQMQLYRKREELKIFADRMAHDLLVSLSKLSLCTEYLEMQTEAEATQNIEQDYALCAINESLDETINLVESFRDYAHVEQMQTSFSNVNLNSLMDHILLDLELELDARGAQIQVDPLPFVSGDPTKLGQLMRILIANAIKYSYHAPFIHVQSIKYDTAWQIAVTERYSEFDKHVTTPPYTDSAIPMNIYSQDILGGMHRRSELPVADEKLNTHVHWSERSGVAGAEITLAICRKIVEAHRGEIEFRPVPGVGMTCHFTIEQDLKSSSKPNGGDAFDDIALSNYRYSISTTMLQDAVDPNGSSR